ncbi:hypothetical protein [Alicyclobacillus mengziensis]|uniref:D-serine dehydratase-like domain-containing protein n=1 Tax=Alicyclobacillus mengziensis TaxID=2931921 RepID=A0A9X7W294_9BACL|nr:hypothetical protein [Alicyclobacillus mengziensis]QSO49371.1 hypothetical protein JZ786_10870 [Alicyclobacillus mengziensis]
MIKDDLATPALVVDKDVLQQVPDAVIVRLSEEHAVIEVEQEGLLGIKDRLEIIPNHVCPVVNLTDTLYVTEGDEVKDIWTVAARGRVR